MSTEQYNFFRVNLVERSIFLANGQTNNFSCICGISNFNFTGPSAALVLVRDNLNVAINKAKMELEAIEQVFLLVNNF